MSYRLSAGPFTTSSVMPEIPLDRLRALRSRAELPLRSLASDLKAFRHTDPTGGFRRKPDSESIKDDIGVTTTCSCLMALALAKKLSDVFGDSPDKIVLDTFKKLVDAPWMSSGLTENNAFTTTLMIRLTGFLSKTIEGISGFASETRKSWEPRLKFSNFPGFVNATERNEITRFQNMSSKMLPKALQSRT